jgi:L-cysteine desulfidase
MNSLCIKVEGLLGHDIEEVCKDMCRLAKHLSLMVETDFNKVQLLATENSDPAELAQWYREQTKHTT